MVLAHAQNWWGITLRSVLGIIFGLIIAIFPGLALIALIVLFGVYLIVDGILALISAVRSTEQNRNWGSLLTEGIIGIAAGFLILAWPNLSAVGLVYLIAFWILLTGIFRISEGVVIRKDVSDEWSLMLNGIVSIIFALVLMIFPEINMVSAARLIGAFLVFFGLMEATLSFRTRNIYRMHRV